MKLSRWIWRTNTAGAIAIANLACFGLVALLYRLLFPDGVGHVNQHPPWKLVFADALPFAMTLLASPVGWFGLVGGLTGPTWWAIVSVPLNAYVWGALGQAVWRRQMQVQRSRERAIEEAMLGCLNPDCSVHFAHYLDQCPACGTRAAERAVKPHIMSERPPILFIVIAGIAAPMTLGGTFVAFAAFFLEWLFVWIVGLAAGAGFILTVVRWINRRDSGRCAGKAMGPTGPAPRSR